MSVTIPPAVRRRVEKFCLALPEVSVHVDDSGSPRRSAAYAYQIRRRRFCLLVAAADPTGAPVPLIVVRADPAEQEAMLSGGHPYFPSRAGYDRVGVLLTDDTDWAEVAELVTDSYRRLAPKKLSALLAPPRPRST